MEKGGEKEGEVVLFLKVVLEVILQKLRLNPKDKVHLADLGLHLWASSPVLGF